jgi:hypothetical protein
LARITIAVFDGAVSSAADTGFLTFTSLEHRLAEEAKHHAAEGAANLPGTYPQGGMFHGHPVKQLDGPKPE